MLLLFACTAKPVLDDTSGRTDSALASVEGYGFENAAYTGQVFRHLLIDDMKSYIGSLTERIDNGEIYPVDGDIAADLDFYLAFDSSTSGQVPHGRSTDPTALQVVYDDVSSGKNLLEKLAGNDAVGQHADWSSDFVGWGDTSPEALVHDHVAAIDALAAARTAGEIPVDPSGTPIGRVYVSPDGVDHQQILDKFLRGGIAFSQATDDYLDDDVEGKGLLQDHVELEEGKEYTALEHSWDEAFGYFGAARSYGDWTDADVKEFGYADVDGDGYVDLTSEYNWGHSVNASKRDVGSVSGTDFSADAFDSFVSGRALLAETAGSELSDDDFATLQGHRDAAVQAWENAIASTVVHYINDTLGDMGRVGTDEYSFDDHAKHWSELKGFALTLQFNPRSPLSDDDFEALHDAIGTAPVLSDASTEALDDYAAQLLGARALLGDAYGFDASDLGDERGENGW